MGEFPPKTTAEIEAEHEAEPELTPAQALERLMRGNDRFVDQTSVHPHQDAERRSKLTNTQKPFAAIFGCSDSRLAAEIIFDVGLGDMFVIRTAGQVISDAVLGSIEYAVDVLEIPLIVILGHDSCGAVTAAVETYCDGTMPRGYVRDLVERITPSVISARAQGVMDVNGTVREHVIQTCDRLADYSRVLSERIADGSVGVVGLTYSLAEGRTTLVSGLGQVQ